MSVGRVEVSVPLVDVDPALVEALVGTSEEWAHAAAAVSEGLCPTCSGRLVPVESAARAAGQCFLHGYWWAGGPDVAYAETGWSLRLDGVPGGRQAADQGVGAARPPAGKNDLDAGVSR